MIREIKNDRLYELKKNANGPKDDKTFYKCGNCATILDEKPDNCPNCRTFFKGTEPLENIYAEETERRVPAFVKCINCKEIITPDTEVCPNPKCGLVYPTKNSSKKPTEAEERIKGRSIGPNEYVCGNCGTVNDIEEKMPAGPKQKIEETQKCIKDFLVEVETTAFNFKASETDSLKDIRLEYGNRYAELIKSGIFDLINEKSKSDIGSFCASFERVYNFKDYSSLKPAYKKLIKKLAEFMKEAGITEEDIKSKNRPLNNEGAEN